MKLMDNKDIFNILLDSDEQIFWSGKPSFKKRLLFYDNRFYIPFMFIRAFILFFISAFLIFLFHFIYSYYVGIYAFIEWDKIFNYTFKFVFNIGLICLFLPVFFLIFDIPIPKKRFLKCLKRTEYFITNKRIFSILTVKPSLLSRLILKKTQEKVINQIFFHHVRYYFIKKDFKSDSLFHFNFFVEYYNSEKVISKYIVKQFQDSLKLIHNDFLKVPYDKYEMLYQMSYIKKKDEIKDILTNKCNLEYKELPDSDKKQPPISNLLNGIIITDKNVKILIKNHEVIIYEKDKRVINWPWSLKYI
ncbi:MAG: hypothetical protein ACP6IY_18715 [Promethearchaeia archaeon]